MVPLIGGRAPAQKTVRREVGDGWNKGGLTSGGGECAPVGVFLVPRLCVFVCRFLFACAGVATPLLRRMNVGRVVLVGEEARISLGMRLRGGYGW